MTEFEKLIFNLRTEGEYESVQSAISQAASLIEKHVKGEKVDSVSLSFLPTELIELETTEDDIELVIQCLKMIVQKDVRSRGSAVWAIGKTLREDMVSFFVDVCENNPNDENTTYQALIAIEDCGINAGWCVIEKISKGKLIKSKEFALEKMEYRKLGVY